jgi:hypothetical protein
VYAINKLQSNRSIYQVDVLSVNFRLESVIGGNPSDVRVVTRSELQKYCCLKHMELIYQPLLEMK